MSKAMTSQRIEAILKQMTMEEKVAQMVQVPCNMVTWEEACAWARRGAGSFLHIMGEKAEELQKIACQTRLGIPVLFGIDAVHGHALNDHATIFPSQLAAACSWNPELVTEMGRVTAKEVRADGLHWTFSPVLCLGRDPRWGRVNETFGEDPYLAGELGAALVRGYQGEDLQSDDSILACAKHYIGYGEAVGARDSCDTEVTHRKVREVFLPPFAKAVQAGCATVMTAYGSLDGTPCTADAWLLKRVLREELGFDGFVVTDWDNVSSLVHQQHVCETEETAAIKAAQSGNDMMMTSLAFYDNAVNAVREGRLEESVIDKAVHSILAVKMRAGLLDHPEKKGDPGCFRCPEHLDTALRAARESIVMLKNNGMLPLKTKIKKIAVIGPNADDILAQYGDWTYFSHPIHMPNRPGERPFVTVREGMEQLCRERDTEICYAKGCNGLPADNDAQWMREAVACASECDAIIFVVGDRLEQIGENKDRADLALGGKQNELFARLRELQIPVCTVLVASKPLCMGRVAQQADAVLVAFNGGMFGGQAVAEVLFGSCNPSGKLPISFPWHSGQVPVYYNALPGWHGGKYMDMPAEPQFVFGEGMSYTTYQMENLRFNTQSMTCTLDVTNIGPVDGIETVQVYFRDEASSVMTPCKQLIAFQRVSLRAGETQTVRMQLKRGDFALVTADEQRIVEPGTFTLMAGSSSRDRDLMFTKFQL